MPVPAILELQINKQILMLSDLINLKCNHVRDLYFLKGHRSGYSE